jgi:hypothetical protein
MCKREHLYIALVNSVHASKFVLWLAKVFGNTQIIKQQRRIFIVRTLNDKPYLLAERRKA